MFLSHYFDLEFRTQATLDLLAYDDVLHLGVVPCSIKGHIVCWRHIEFLEVHLDSRSKLGVAPYQRRLFP